MTKTVYKHLVSCFLVHCLSSLNLSAMADRLCLRTSILLNSHIFKYLLLSQLFRISLHQESFILSLEDSIAPVFRVLHRSCFLSSAIFSTLLSDRMGPQKFQTKIFRIDHE